MDLDYLDIYDDLDAFQKTEEKKSIELRELEAKCLDSLKSIEALQVENENLKKRIERIGINFQNLLDTAKAEIKRKDKQIEQLRKEKDDICFRRTRPRKESLDLAGDNNTTNNWYKNHSEFPERDYRTTATERPQRNPFQDYSVADSGQASRSRSHHNHEGHNVRIPNETFKNSRRDERSERKNENESKREKKPRNNSPTGEHNSRYRDRSRERDRSGWAPSREYSRSRNRSTEHSRREERDHRNQKFDDYTRRHRSRYSGQDPKTRFDNQEYNWERRGDFKKLQHGDNKNEFKANYNTEYSKKSKIETTSKYVDEPKPSNLFRGKCLKSGEREITEGDKGLTPKGNSTEIKANEVLIEKKLTKESLLGLECNSGSESNNTTDQTVTSNCMTTPNKSTLFDILFGGTPKKVGTVNITNESELAKSNISSATTSPSKYTDSSERNTKSPTTNELNSNIDDCSTDSNKEFDFRYLQTINAVTNMSKPKECADYNDGLVKSFTATSTKETSNTVNVSIGSERVVSQSDDDDYIEINKTKAKKNVIDVEKSASDKVTISSFPNLGAVQILQNSRLPNIYEIRAFQRRLKEETAATENSKRESIAKMKDAELNVTKPSRGTPEKTAKMIAQNQETDSKAPQSATIAGSNKVVIAKEVLGKADINNDKIIRIEKIKTVTIKDGSKNSNMVVNANDLEKAEVIADTKSSTNPKNTVLRVTATLEEGKNCELKNEEVVIAMSIPETTSTETLDLENEVSSSKRTAEKSAVLIGKINHEKIATGSTSFGETETLLQKVKSVEKVSVTNKIKADTIVLPHIECNGPSAVENRVMETDGTIHEAERKFSNLHTNSPTENVEAAACIDNDNKLSDDIITSESKAGSLKVSKKPQQPPEDMKVTSNNCPPNDQLSCNSDSCVDTTVINDLEASGENTTKLMDLCDGKTKHLTEESSINIHSKDSAKNNKSTCDINNDVYTTVINVPKATGENTGQLLDLNDVETKTTVIDAKSITIDLLVDKNCDKETNEGDAQREIVSPEATKVIIDELQPITERNEMNSVDILNEVVGNKGISSDQLAKVGRIQSDRNVINEEDIATDKSNVQKVFLEHTSIAKQKTIDQRKIFDESTLAESEKMLNCTNTAKDDSNVTETERGNTVSSEISMSNATMAIGSSAETISMDRANLKLPPKPVVMHQTQKKFPLEVTNTIMTAAAVEKSVNGSYAYSALIDNMKRSEIMWKFKIPKMSAKRKRDDESEAKNIKNIDLNEGIDEKVATKVEEATNKVGESTNTLSKKSKKDDKIVKLTASEIIQVPDVSAKIERERLLKDETEAEKQRLLEQEKSRSIIKEIDNWARRTVGETTETIEKEKQISESVCVDEERSIKNANILPKSQKDQNYCATESNVVEKTTGTERCGKYNKEEMKFNVDSTRTTDHISDNRTKYKPQQVDGQRVLSKEKLKNNESAKHCLLDRRNELEKVVIVTENTKEKTDIPRFSNNNNSESKSRNKSPGRLPSITMEEKKHATKILQQHKNHLTEEPRSCVEAIRKPEEHKAKLLERRKSQNSEENSLSKTICHTHATPSSQKQKSESEIQQEKTPIQKVKSNEEENEKKGQPQALKGEKAAQKDNKEQSSTRLTYKEIENKSLPAKLESSLAKETHSDPQATHVERSTEVQKLRKEHQKMNSKKRTAEKTVTVKEVEENEICEKRAKIDVAEEEVYSIQNVCDRGAHFSGSFKVVTPIHDSQSSQITPTCSDTIKETTEGEVTASTLRKEAKRRRSVTLTDANLSSDSVMCRDQPQQRKIKLLSTRIELRDEDKASVDTVTSTQSSGLVELDVGTQHKNEDILDILQNDRTIDTNCESLSAPQTPSSLPANISQDAKYEEIDSRMQLIFASPKDSDKTSTLTAIDKQNSTASDLIKVLQPVASQPATESVNGSLAPMPISAIAPPPVVNTTPVVVNATPPVVNPLPTVVNASSPVGIVSPTVVNPAPPVVNDSSPVVSGTPPLTATAPTTDLSVSDTILSDITINSFHTSSTNLTVDETHQSTINMNSSLSDSNASTKHISLGSSDYRFEKVSENVVNLFITRKRRGKRKPNASIATTNTIPTI